MKRLFIVICLFIWMPIPAMGGWFGPSNYEECILENMKGVTSDAAVRAIARACRAKFPRKVTERYADVPMSVLKEITAKTWFIDKAHPDASRTGNFYAELYNNNAKWSIHLIKMRIIDKATGTYEDVLGMDEQTRRYLDTGKAVAIERAGGSKALLYDLTDDDYIRIGKERLKEKERGGFLRRLTSTLGGLVDTDKSKCFGFFVQKVPVKWEWNIIGAKGYSKP